MFPTTDGKGLKRILQHLDELCVTTVERKCWKIARWIVPNFTRMTNSFMIFVFMIFLLYVCMYACMYHIHKYIYRCDSGHVSYIFIAPSALLSSISGSASYIFFLLFLQHLWQCLIHIHRHLRAQQQHLCQCRRIPQQQSRQCLIHSHHHLRWHAAPQVPVFVLLH